jgi:hypothetical protein
MTLGSNWRKRASRGTWWCQRVRADWYHGLHLGLRDGQATEVCVGAEDLDVAWSEGS